MFKAKASYHKAPGWRCGLLHLGCRWLGVSFVVYIIPTS